MTNPAAVHGALGALDTALAGDDERQVYRLIRTAVESCRQHLPGLLERLRQHISVHCVVSGLDRSAVLAALGAPSRHDAYPGDL